MAVIGLIQTMLQVNGVSDDRLCSSNIPEFQTRRFSNPPIFTGEKNWSRTLFLRSVPPMYLDMFQW